MTLNKTVGPNFSGSIKTSARACAAVLALFVVTQFGVAYGQDSPKKIPIDVRLQPNSTQPASMPEPARVRNQTQVFVRVIGLSPLETCKLGDLKAEQIQPANGLEGFIKELAGFGAFGFGPGSGEELLASKLKEQIPANKRPDATKVSPGFMQLYNIVDQRVTELNSPLGETLDRQKEDWEHLKTVSQEFTRFLQDDFRQSGRDRFERSRRMLDSYAKEISKPTLPQGTLDLIQAQSQEQTVLISMIHKQFDSELAGNRSELEAVIDLDEKATRNQTALSRILDTTKALDDQRNKLVSMNEAVQQIAWSPEVRKLPLPKGRNAKITDSVSCVSLLDKTKITLDPVPVSVTYQNPPTLALSMGMLLSTLEKREIGTSPVKTGTDPSGVATFKNTFAITDQAGAQAIPFAFLNLKVYGRQVASHDFTFNLSGGAGVNPNSGTKEPEFFSGVAFGMDRMLVHAGVHTGRLQRLGGGFQEGETVPDKFPTTLPIFRRYKNKFAVGLSFRMMP